MRIRHRKAALLSFLLATVGLGSYATLIEPAPRATPVRPAADDASPAAAVSREALAPPPVGSGVASRVGPYRLLKELGTGGMGTVHLAESIEGGARRVALKRIRQSRFSPELAAQFERERRALGTADHDFVARLYDSGSTEEGDPWVAMEYVAGEPITEFCDRRRLDVEARLELFADVCEAVQHLHDRGILHRDLKPENILVVERGGRAVPKIIDLGLARVPGGKAEEAEGVMGTPAFMAPELFALPANEIDARSDVYSLGVLLRQLLIGAQPSGGGVLGIALRATLEDSLSPSTQLTEMGQSATKVARRRSTRVAGLRRRLRGALDRAVQSATARQREERYASVSELASDLERDLRHRQRWQRSLRTLWISSAAAGAAFLGGLLA